MAAIPSTVPGAVTAYNPATGGVPTVPNLIDIYGQATAANQGALPGIEQLAGGVNQFNQQQLMANLRSSLPGYDAMTAASTGNIENLLAGQIPQDVVGQITQGAAERGIATGLYDSPNANAALLRSLGLTSLGLQGQGESELTAAIGRTPQAQPMDLTKLMVNPTDLYEAQLLANIYASAPQPASAANALLGLQAGGFNKGRNTAPGVTLPASTTGTGTSVTNFRPTVPTPTATTGKWVFDQSTGAYYNTLTGEIADTPGGTPWQGFSWGGLQTPAQWAWEDALGAYYDPNTGAISDSPVGAGNQYATNMNEAPPSGMADDFWGLYGGD